MRPVRRRRLHRPAHERHGDGERHQGRPRPHRISTLRVPRLLLLRLHRPLARLRTGDAASPHRFMGGEPSDFYGLVNDGETGNDFGLLTTLQRGKL